MILYAAFVFDENSNDFCCIVICIIITTTIIIIIIIIVIILITSSSSSSLSSSSSSSLSSPSSSCYARVVCPCRGTCKINRHQVGSLCFVSRWWLHIVARMARWVRSGCGLLGEGARGNFVFG
jgi:hypothetical protein